MKIITFLIAFGLMLNAANILEEIDRKLTPISAQIYKKLVNIEPDGSKKEFLLFQAKKDKDKIQYQKR